MTLKERIILKFALPVKGSFEDLILIKSITSKIEVTPEEIDKFEIKSNEQGTVWNKEGLEAIFNIDFTGTEKSVLLKILNTQSKEQNLSMDLLDFYQSLK